MAQRIDNDLKQVAGPTPAPAQAARAPRDRRAAGARTGALVARRRRRDDAFTAVQRPTLSWP
ncbi:hypothetical protein [Massilia sp. DWR3-1-1]|uniref:hypothetical protein n=1 Tax=Massilia sp. DWR3-1-1 TaxID=2804559 RepID=UPI003CFB0073